MVKISLLNSFNWGLLREYFSVYKKRITFSIFLVCFIRYFNYRIKKLNELVSCSVIKTGLCKYSLFRFFIVQYKIYRILWLSFISSLYTKLYGPLFLSKNILLGKYYYNSKWYYFPIIIKRGPKKNLESDNDLISSIAGPNIDFHGIKLKPCDLNMKTLKIIVDDEVKNFDENEIIELH